MLTGVARGCPDCQGERIFVPVDDCDGDVCEYCCTSCGAAVLIDPAFEMSLTLTKVA
jgi:hypothetical protein